MSNISRRLYRSRRERMFFGVAGGLGEYFNVDPTLIRVIFVVTALAGGPGLVAYIILALITPEEPYGPISAPPAEPAPVAEPAPPAEAEQPEEPQEPVPPAEG